MATDTVDITWEQLRANIHMLAKERGWHHGVPIMSFTDPTRKVVLAKGCPLSDVHGHDRPVSFDAPPGGFVCRHSDISETDYEEPVNEWRIKPKVVGSYRRGRKYHLAKLDTDQLRFQVYLKSLMCGVGAVDSQAEFYAMISLFKRLNDNQRDAYTIMGAFPETSKRSGVTYILRKGLPTIAMKCRPCEGGETRHFLAALCIHPLGWYHGTHVGVCPPSDEVLGVLLQIRADEHGLWKRAHHLTIDDPMAAI